MNASNEKRNAVIYCRVSTKEQVEEGNSLVTQERNCREYAAKNNYTIIQVFIERGESAKTAERTELQNLFKFCALKKNEINAVISYKIDRISRNTDDYSQIRILLKRYGVEIKSTSEHFEDNPAGRFMENIIANVAQFDNDVRTERWVGGLKQAVLEGRYVWPSPVGYSNTKINGKANLIQNEKSVLVKQAFEEAAKEINSINEIRIKMAQLGLAQKDGRPLAKSLFYRILNNEIYTGWICKFGEKVKGCFEPVISEELFKQVQRRINSKKENRNYSLENPDFPLRRFVLSQTGEKLTGAWSQGRNKKYAYYRFIKSNQQFRKLALEETFCNFLNEYALPENLFVHFKKIVKKLLTDYSDKKQLLAEELIKKQGLLQKRKSQLIEKNLSGVISDSILKEQLESVENDLWVIYQSLENRKVNSITSNEVLERLTDFLTKPGEFWQKQPFEIKKKLQWFVFPKGVTFCSEKFRTSEISNVYMIKKLFSEKEFSIVDYPELYYKHDKSANYSALSEKDFLVKWSEFQNSLTELDNIIHTE